MIFLVNGNWSPWSAESCSTTCGAGERRKTRTCSNPPAQYGGFECDLSTGTGRGKEESAMESCNLKSCAGKVTNAW